MPVSTNDALYQDVQTRIDEVTREASAAYRDRDFNRWNKALYTLKYLQDSMERIKVMEVGA